MPERTNRFVLKYPLEIQDSGMLAKEQELDSELRFLSSVIPGQRLDDLIFGFPPFVLEQENLESDINLSVMAMSIKIAIADYISNIFVLDVKFVSDSDNRRYFIEIIYQDSFKMQDLRTMLIKFPFDGQ